MSRTKLANLTVDQLVERFVAIALDQHEAMRHDDNADAIVSMGRWMMSNRS